jgi:hypothetical protein
MIRLTPLIPAKDFALGSDMFVAMSTEQHAVVPRNHVTIRDTVELGGHGQEGRVDWKRQ